MKKIFLNLSTRNKLLAGFMSVLLVTLIVEYNEYHNLSRFSKIHSVIVEANQTRSSIKDLKVFITEDTKVMQDILYANSNEDLEIFILKHLELSNGFLTEMQKLSEINKRQTNGLLLINSQGQNAIIQIMDTYRNLIIPSFEQMKRLKQEFFSLDDDLNESVSDMVIEPDSLSESIAAESSRTSERSIKLKDELQKKYKDANAFSTQILSRLNIQLEANVNNSLKDLEQQASSIRQTVLKNAILVLLIGGIVVFFIATFLSTIIASHLEKVQEVLEKLGEGELPEYISEERYDEIGNISRAMQKLIAALYRTSRFAVAIGQSKFDESFVPLSSRDVLGNSLLEMRKSLLVANTENNKRQIEDQRRSWATEGLAKFSDILRSSSGKVNDLNARVISEIVKYIGANQGGIFIVNDRDSKQVFLELSAAYAYNRRKYLHKSIKIGEGLIGAAVIEKYTVYLTELPEKYLEIESALGGANPRTLIVVPLKVEDRVFGVMEIASFREYEAFEIEFIERISESIASTLATIKINSKTADLLEQSRVQAQEMVEKEDMLRLEIQSQERELQKQSKFIAELKHKIDEHNHARLENDKREEQRLFSLKKIEADSKTKEQELALELKRHKDMLNATRDVLILLNVDGIIEQVNQAGIVLFGYEASEFVGLSLENFVEKKFYDNLSKALDRKDNRYIKDIISEEHQVVIYRKDNSSENVSMLIQPISSSGRIFYVISVSKSVDVIGQDLFQSRQVDKHIAKEFRDRIRIEELTEILKKNNIVVNDSLDENSLIEWSSEFEFGIDVIDEQHHKWIYFINKFHRALSEGAGNESLLETMRELIEYTDYHFNFEERYFKELMFVGAKEHIQAHASFVEHILAVQADFRMGKPDAAYKMVNYFKNWVQSHITIEDKQYVKLFKDNNVKYSMF